MNAPTKKIDSLFGLAMHNFRRSVQRFYISAYRMANPEFTHEKSAHEMECISICKKLIKMEDSILLMTPLTDKRFIKNEKMGIYVIMEKYNVQVINHIYSYSITLGDKSWGKLIDFYNQEIEKRRNQFESEIRSNIKHSLKNILHDIEEKI
jgi:hypothetical protein